MSRAVKIIGAGLASLESIPIMVDEMVKAGVPLLTPLAYDHDRGQIETYRQHMGELLRGPLAGKYKWTEDSLVSEMSVQSAERIKALLKARNSVHYSINHLDEGSSIVHLADTPAVLALWVDDEVDAIWDQIWSEWKQFRQDHIAVKDLLIVIVYCPEGPTSGTVGITLGSKLRFQLEEALSGGEVEGTITICGIELCPPMEYDEVRRSNQVDNAFRGYVARQELLSTALEELRPRPFHYCLAVDGGREPVWLTGPAASAVTQSLPELDRLGARVAISVAKGILKGDMRESDELLRLSWRWQVIPFQVYLHPAPLTVLRCLSRFPSLTEQMADNDTVLGDFARGLGELRKTFDRDSEAFAHCHIASGDIGELEQTVGQWERAQRGWREANKDAKSFWRWLVKGRKKLQERVDSAQLDLQNAFRSVRLEWDQCTAGVAETFRKSRVPFGAQIELEQSQVREYLMSPRAMGVLIPMLQRSEVVNEIRDRTTGYLYRYRREGGLTTGCFERIIVTYVGHPENSVFLPSLGVFAEHISGEDWNDKRSHVSIRGANESFMREVAAQSPEDYYLGLEAFVFAAPAVIEDVSSFPDLAKIEDDVVRDNKQWCQFAKYYAFKLPQELLDAYTSEFGQ